MSKTPEPQAQSSSERRQSLVFAFGVGTFEDFDPDAPEPDFGKWKSAFLPLDLMIAGDNAIYDKLSKKERAAWRLLCDALEAVDRVHQLYRSDPIMFRKVTGELAFLPSLHSLHPDAGRFNRDFLARSGLGQSSTHGEAGRNPQHLARQPWPVRYAYAVINTIDLTLDTYGENLDFWAEAFGYGVKHPIRLSLYEEAARKLGMTGVRLRRELKKYEGTYQILPKWTKTLRKLRRPFNALHVLDYWRTGKAMISEELPDFHERPEWEGYRRRKYPGGGKPGTVQHAIFKDILTALRTIAGCNKQGAAKSAGQ